ncbi:carboxypeptidase-like regulatory domain-containing protein [Bremerella alba]|uniref:Carboxypeptidase regulatory-like domain-containing protein n=1 Tax=Bremerella alba TaxID=980252 RepID=A0A7V8V271_9BACT|nr:carboxypeptidase-like regulatory domain-containing protein [Bremerella alba]MBA2113554.1 hypothetical protein [Bremerella alba]
MTRLIVIATIVASSLTVGCSRQQITRVTVSGVVRLEGQPVPNVEVAFTSQSNPMAFGITDAEGKYLLATRRYGEGVAPGDYTVKIRNIKGSTVPKTYDQRGVETITVSREEANSFDFDLSKNPGKSKLKADSGDGAAES